MSEGIITAPYGTWQSAISAESVGSGSHIFEIKLYQDDIYCVEIRPLETRARYSLLKINVNGGEHIEIINAPFSVRSTVHEYGGGAFVLSSDSVFFSNFLDQIIYKRARSGANLPVIPLTRTGSRYADGVFDDLRNRVVSVKEHHPVPEKRDAINSLVSINSGAYPGKEEVLVSGNDFYSFPRLNSDCSKLAWISWNFPNMPFDGAELWLADFDTAGRLKNKLKIAGGSDESVTQPRWSKSNGLYFISDRSGYWNLYRWSKRGGVRAIYPKEFDFCHPDWYLGLSSYAIASSGNIVCTFSENGIWRLAIHDPDSSEFEIIETPFTDIGHVEASKDYAVFLAGTPSESHAIYKLDLATKKCDKIYASSGEASDPNLLSFPVASDFPTANGLIVHSFYYRPWNPGYALPETELPPLVVMAHGGPTSAATNVVRGTIQFFTSRGFAVLDVNYGGSSGFGREYRRRLNGQWGVVDVQDCIQGALELAREKKVDENRMVIRGGSAGGFTTLCALTMSTAFKAGACYYGISDLERWELDCHKFESQYLHSLIGAYPQEKELFLERSPTIHAANATGPLILFQGLEDKVVPPSQSELMVQKLREKGQAVEYIAFEEEQHDFRKGKNIAKALELELAFFQRALGLKKN